MKKGRKQFERECEPINRLIIAIFQQAVEDYGSPDRYTLLPKAKYYRIPGSRIRRLRYIQNEAGHALFDKDRLESLGLMSGLITPEKMREIRLRALEKQLYYNLSNHKKQ